MPLAELTRIVPAFLVALKFMSAGAWRDVKTHRDAALAGRVDQELQ